MLWKKDGRIIVCGECRSVKTDSGQYLALENMTKEDKAEFLSNWDRDNVSFVQCSSCYRKKRKTDIGEDLCRTYPMKQITPSVIEKESKSS